jgi:cysteine desulfurase
MQTPETVYLDNAATTRVAPEVRAAMLPTLESAWGNPAALYSLGTEAARLVDEARERVARLVGAAEPTEICFTGGGTESNNWALAGVLAASRRRRLVVSAIEHHAVLEPAAALKRLGLAEEVTVLPVDAEGRLDPDDLHAALSAETALVSIMHANNEIGTVQPVAELAALAHEAGALFHTDAVQTVGKLPVAVQEWGVDLLSLSAHKFHGPKGAGALYRRRGVRLEPLLHGGGQEAGQRSGTVNVPGVVGLGAAAELARKGREEEAPRLRALADRLWREVEAAVPRVRRNGAPEGCLPGLLHLTVAGAEGEAMVMYLDRDYGICCSTGSACATGRTGPSHVLRALGRPDEEARGSLRFSFSRTTTEAEVLTAARALPEVIGKVRAMSPTWRG